MAMTVQLSTPLLSYRPPNTDSFERTISQRPARLPFPMATRRQALDDGGQTHFRVEESYDFGKTRNILGDIAHQSLTRSVRPVPDTIHLVRKPKSPSATCDKRGRDPTAGSSQLGRLGSFQPHNHSVFCTVQDGKAQPVQEGSNKRSITCTGIPDVLQLTSIGLRERKNSLFGLTSAYPQHFSSAAAPGPTASANMGRYRRRSLNLDGGVVPDAHPRRCHSANSEHLQSNHSSPSASIRPRHDGSKFPRKTGSRTRSKLHPCLRHMHVCPSST